MGDMREELRASVNNGDLQSEIDKQAKDEKYKEITTNVKNKKVNDQDLMYVIQDAVQKIIGSNLYSVSQNPRIKNTSDSEEIERMDDCVLQSDVFNSLKEFLGHITIKGNDYLKIINLLSGKTDKKGKELLTELVDNMQINGMDKESILIKKMNQIKENSENQR